MDVVILVLIEYLFMFKCTFTVVTRANTNDNMAACCPEGVKFEPGSQRVI